MKHKLLDEYIREGYPLRRTTHSNVYYDDIIRTFIVYSSDGNNTIEVYGKGRFEASIKIADFLLKEYLEEIKKEIL